MPLPCPPQMFIKDISPYLVRWRFLGRIMDIRTTTTKRGQPMTTLIISEGDPLAGETADTIEVKYLGELTQPLCEHLTLGKHYEFTHTGASVSVGCRFYCFCCDSLCVNMHRTNYISHHHPPQLSTPLPQFAPPPGRHRYNVWYYSTAAPPSPVLDTAPAFASYATLKNAAPDSLFDCRLVFKDIENIHRYDACNKCWRKVTAVASGNAAECRTHGPVETEAIRSGYCATIVANVMGDDESNPITVKAINSPPLIEIHRATQQDAPIQTILRSTADPGPGSVATAPELLLQAIIDPPTATTSEPAQDTAPDANLKRSRPPTPPPPPEEIQTTERGTDGGKHRRKILRRSNLSVSDSAEMPQTETGGRAGNAPNLPDGEDEPVEIAEDAAGSGCSRE